MESSRLAAELDGTVSALLERHLDKTKEWFPHELVPWSQGRDFEPGETWDGDDMALPDAVRSALFVNLLTEDNLPYYFNDIDRLFGADGPWGEWNRRWTAEEGRHSIVIRDWMTVTRALDPVVLERARMHQMSHGYDHPIAGLCEGVVYVTLQELATRISHRNTGKMLGEGAGQEIMGRVANDENLHFLFYRDVASAALELDPSSMVLAIERQVRTFEMPGTGIPDFKAHAAAIADAGIYDFTLHHEQILVPVVIRHWKLESLTGLSDEAERARDATLSHMTRLERVAKRLASRREERMQQVSA